MKTKLFLDTTKEVKKYVSALFWCKNKSQVFGWSQKIQKQIGSRKDERLLLNNTFFSSWCVSWRILRKPHHGLFRRNTQKRWFVSKKHSEKNRFFQQWCCSWKTASFKTIVEQKMKKKQQTAPSCFKKRKEPISQRYDSSTDSWFFNVEELYRCDIVVILLLYRCYIVVI